MKVLLVEPNYKSKFPPLGLMRLSTLHKDRGDKTFFIKGESEEIQQKHWDRIYVSSLFTYELPITIRTAKYYLNSVSDPKKNLFIGGIGATLLPNYVLESLQCNLIQGQLNRSNMLGLNEKPVANLIPDYDLIRDSNYEYIPKDSYFLRISEGCIRKCKFCAVPVLEPNFGYLQNPIIQVNEIIHKYGEKQNLVVLDNNILALNSFDEIINEIIFLGFNKNGNKKRTVDFNQGLDARLIDKNIAALLSKITISPIRLAFDNIVIKDAYTKAIALLAEFGFLNFTNYVMYNFTDTPEHFYERIFYNIELNLKYSIRITGFPMKYAPIQNINRYYVSPKWKWRYLRGIQCILNATHGLTSPNPSFLENAFGNSFDEFINIISMPDNYIIYRKKYENEAVDWKQKYSHLSKNDKNEFIDLLGILHNLPIKKKREEMKRSKKFHDLLIHYYSNVFLLK